MLEPHAVVHQSVYTVKKCVDFTAKYLFFVCFFLLFFFCFVFRASICRAFLEIKPYGRVMLTDSTRKYLCRVEGQNDQKQYTYCA